MTGRSLNDRTKRLLKEVVVLSSLLCVALTIGFVVGGGTLRGPSAVAYFILLVGCLALAVGLALGENE